jgi:TM2 domain-containing membrane protein YozV
VKKNIKAALLSGLVFPGIGQIYKGSKIKGLIIIFAVNFLFLIAFALIIRNIYLLIISGHFTSTPDPVIMAKRIIRETPGLSWLTGTLLCVWIYSIADALFSGFGNRS